MENIIEIGVGFLNLIATSVLGYMAYKLTHHYSKKSQHLNEDIIFHQLFRDFNERYNKLNNALNHLENNTEELYNKLLI